MPVVISRGRVLINQERGTDLVFDGKFSAVHDHGFVHLDDCMADDMSVVNSARVSFGKASEGLNDADIGLIRFLMRERHGTPFEHNTFRFHVRCPIFVAREWFRHRIGSFNEFSGRYAEMPNMAYQPAAEDLRTQVGKPGSYTFEPISETIGSEVSTIIDSAYKAAWDAYEKLLSLGLAKELSRSVLPLGSYTEFYWTVNARSLMNFLSLRTADTALREIRDYAVEIERHFSGQMPHTYKAWIDFEKVCP